MQYSVYEINKLAEDAKKNIKARWRLGAILYQLDQEGYKIITREDGLIEIKKEG